MKKITKKEFKEKTGENPEDVLGNDWENESEELDEKVSAQKPEGDNSLAEIAVSIPTNELSAKDTAAMIADTEKKIELIAGFIKRQLKEGKDYGQIAFHAKNCPNYGRSGKLETTCGSYCKMSKPFLQKPGSEKFAILFNHRAKFLWEHKDFAQGEFAAKCLLLNKKTQEVMGEGYGSAYRAEKQNWTNNEAIKMACKRAQIDAALRTYGLSEHFTQDLDDMEARETPPMPQNRPVARVYAPTRPTNLNRAPNAPRAILEPNTPITQPQMNKIFFQLDRLGKDKDWFEKWTGQYGVEKIENLTKGMASKFIDLMDKKLTAKPEMETTIDISEPRDYPKQDTEISEAEVVAPDEWSGF
jgi:hypothetical protein